MAAIPPQRETWFKSLTPIAFTEINKTIAVANAANIGEILGNSFLLQRSPIGQEGKIGLSITTMSDTGDTALPWLLASIYFVRMTGRSTFPNFISVGRMSNNDIVIAHTSISKFHAFFSHDGDALQLFDAGSHNGTFADGARVPKRGKGDAVAVKSGMLIRFGTIEFIYLDAQGLATQLMSSQR